MNWKSIRLELASTGEFPAGSVSRAYLIRLPLDEGDKVDQAAFSRHPSRATVRRHWSSEADQRGVIVQADGHWAMRCSGTPERLLDLNGCGLRPGEQVRVVEPDGRALPFRITSVR